MKVVRVNDFDIPSDENDYDELVAFADTMASIEQFEAIPKSDYETRLKADLVAMLEELSMKIGEIEDGYVEFDEENKRSLSMIPLESVERLIDEEINSLKEGKNGENNN